MNENMEHKPDVILLSPDPMTKEDVALLLEAARLVDPSRLGLRRTMRLLSNPSLGQVFFISMEAGVAMMGRLRERAEDRIIQLEKLRVEAEAAPIWTEELRLRETAFERANRHRPFYERRRKW